MDDDKKKTGGQQEQQAAQQTQTVQNTQQPQGEKQPAWKQAVEAQRKEAARLREYANSEVKIDTEGQTKPWDEFLKDKETQRLKEDDAHKAAREKRERTTRRLAALADGLVALSNVTGAMFGATPLKQTQDNTLSAGHRKQVKEAAEQRRKNNSQYEVARNHALALQQKQDAANVKRYNEEVKARKEAGKNALSIEQRIAKMEQAQDNADKRQKLAEERLALSKEKEERMANKVSGGKSSSKGGGSTSKGGSSDAYRYWMSLTEEEKKQWRDFNKRGKEDIADYPEMDANGNFKTDEDGNLVFPSTTTYPKDDKAFIELVWRERQGMGKGHSQSGKQKKSIQGFSGSKSQPTKTTTNKKKTIAGFGTK